MRIQWHGAGTRTVGDADARYEWSERTGYVQDVESKALCAELLGQPGETFTAVEAVDDGGIQAPPITMEK